MRPNKGKKGPRAWGPNDHNTQKSLCPSPPEDVIKLRLLELSARLSVFGLLAHLAHLIEYEFRRGVSKKCDEGTRNAIVVVSCSKAALHENA